MTIEQKYEAAIWLLKTQTSLMLQGDTNPGAMAGSIQAVEAHNPQLFEALKAVIREELI
jgi:hypothetical protein